LLLLQKIVDLYGKPQKLFCTFANNMKFLRVL
jgi:hypothetical protein